MPTKENKRQARGLVEGLETRAHAGPSVCPTEIVSARTFLEQNEFAPTSDYFSRLERLQNCVGQRPVQAQTQTLTRPEKRNYGGEAAGCWMQIQSVYDHVILSVCYDGEFNSRRGRVKISHRFNQAGRMDFVELKFLRSLQPCLAGEIRKLILMKDYKSLQSDWLEGEAHVLRVLPQELLFLYSNLFRVPRAEMLAWLINIGHRTVADLMTELRAGRVNGFHGEEQPPANQLRLTDVEGDAVALPILKQAANLETTGEVTDAQSMVVRYLRR
jgi:hypothetical protein